MTGRATAPVLGLHKGSPATQTTLILIGVACIVGAIVGGGVKLVQVEVRAFDSLQRQILLGVFGIILVGAGLVMGNEPSVDRDPSKLVTGDSAATKPNVDIFWCETPGGGSANRDAGARVGAALQADGRVARVRVRLLSLATNARPDYSIANDIVRFDPGERGEATLLASLATSAAGRSFAPAPALPGTPSVNYLSVFVCGAH